MEEIINIKTSEPTKILKENILEELLDKSICLLGKSHSHYMNILQDLKLRLLEQRFHLAILGQFKRGKSTLINALLGESILPSAIIPVTAIPTFISYSKHVSVYVSFLNGKDPLNIDIQNKDQIRDILNNYVTENKNPNNNLGVSKVEVFYPVEFLSNGIVIIDTPGIGSTHRHNTETTLNFLAQCDAALIVLSIDPPPTEVEIEFFKEVCLKVSRIFFILNKIDYISPDERNVAEEFIYKVLREKAGIKEPIKLFSLSARLGLEAKKINDLQKLKESGLYDLEEFLKQFIAQDKASTLFDAIIKKAVNALQNIRLELELSIKALKMPIGEIESKLKLFKQKTAEMESRKDSIRDMIAGDHNRLLEFLEKECLGLKEKAYSHFKKVVETKISNSRAIPSYQDIHDMIAEEVPVFFEHELGNLQQTINKKLIGIIEKHCKILDEFLEYIRNSAEDIFEVPHISNNSIGKIELKRKPYWITGKWSTSEIPISGAFLDIFFPLSLRKKRITKRLNEHLEQLILENIEHIRYSILQNIEDTFTHFNSEIDKWIKESISLTQDAVEWAIEKKKHKVNEVSDEINKLEKTNKELINLIVELEKIKEI
jgi:GTPase Era involved in 16S rRNA processing